VPNVYFNFALVPIWIMSSSPSPYWKMDIIKFHSVIFLVWWSELSGITVQLFRLRCVTTAKHSVVPCVMTIALWYHSPVVQVTLCYYSKTQCNQHNWTTVSKSSDHKNMEHHTMKLNNIHLPLKRGGEKDTIHIGSRAKLKQTLDTY
jgi:hypothetical protein